MSNKVGDTEDMKVKSLGLFIPIMSVCLLSTFTYGAVFIQTFTVQSEADDGIATGVQVQDVASTYLAIGDARTYSTPFQMSGMRFTNIIIPRSATIISANLKIRSLDSNYRGKINGKIATEATDDSGDFSGRYISDAILTTSSVHWDQKSNWAANTWHTSPDISSLIQEVVNRAGWYSGNAIALYYMTRTDSGKERWFGAYSEAGTHTPQLEITYQMLTISGTVLTTDGVGLEGVRVSAGSQIDQTLTDATGYYEIQIPSNWSGVISVSKKDWGFAERAHNYNSVSADQIDQDFIAFQPVISGYVQVETGTGVATVSIIANDGEYIAETDGVGYYEIQVPYGWNGTITPFKEEFILSPVTLTFSLVIDDQSDNSFIAYPQRYGGGNGTQKYPFEIWTVEQLNNIGLHLEDWDKHFILMQDIDMSILSGGQYNLIGTETDPFTGTFNGNFQIVSNFIYDDVNKNYIGLFSFLEEADINNIRLENVNISGGSTIGGLVASCSNSYIENCSMTGIVSGENTVGGLVGLFNNSSTIRESSAAGNVSGESNVGGLVGFNNGWFIINSYVKGTVSGTSSIGGIIGYAQTFSYIIESYSSSTVSGETDIGGFIGRSYGSISASKITDSFWDISKNPTLTGIGNSEDPSTLIGITSGDLIDPAMFISYGWDFISMGDGPDDVWAFRAGDDSPALWHQLDPLPPLPFTGGGTEDDPYLISNAIELNSIGGNPRFRKSYLKLTNDIDLVGMIYFPIGHGTYTVFRGGFDGDNYTISNMHINENEKYVGLIRHPYYATIKNVTLQDPNIITTGGNVGGIAGRMDYGDILNCKVEGGSISGGSYCGGVVGYSYYGNIENCQTLCAVSGGNYTGGLAGYNYRGDIYYSHSIEQDVQGNKYVGGFTGNSYGGNISHSSSDSNVWASGDYAGGFVGTQSTSIKYSSSAGTVISSGDHVGGFTGSQNGSIYNCYSTCDAEGQQFVGGFIGKKLDRGSVVDCYSTGNVQGQDYYGGFAGVSEYPNVFYSCFWDIETSGQTISDGGVGKTTSEMFDPNTYLSEGWDFVGESENGVADIWTEPNQPGYPVLSLHESPLPPLPTFSGGSGDIDDPFLISSADELNQIGGNQRLHDKSFVLINDINLSEIEEFNVIGNTSPDYFKGQLFGEGHNIYNLNTTIFSRLDGPECFVKDINFVDPNTVGIGSACLAINVMNAQIQNCNVIGGITVTSGLVNSNYIYGKITNCNVACDVLSSSARAGGLAYNNSGTISNCSFQGNIIITGASTSTNYVGGLVATNSGLITKSFVEGNIEGDENVGGLVGLNYSTISECYCSADVSGDYFVGGCVGLQESSAIISNCYANGDVYARRYAGGFIGKIDGGVVENCYSTGLVGVSQYYPGGFTANNSGLTAYCFWDINTSGLTTSEGGYARTTEQMKRAETFVGWGVEPVWTIDEENDYPRLAWGNQLGEIITTSTYQGGGTENSPFLITSFQELFAMGMDERDNGKRFRFESDFDMSAYPNKMIEGNGYVDGNGHTISNFVYDSNDIDHVGVFASLTGAENLIVENVSITAPVSSYVGGLVGECRGDIINCQITGTVTGLDYVGGIIGYSIYGGDTEISGCSFVGTLQGRDCVGGIVGYCYYKREGLSNCYFSGEVNGNNAIGGIAGSIRSTDISNCYSTGTIHGNSSVGGAFGSAGSSGSSSYACNLFQCSSNTQVYGTGNYVGGFIGRLSYSTMEECWSKGTVQGFDYVGGLAGTGTSMVNCYSNCSVTGNEYVGGFAGSAGSIRACYSSGSVTGNSMVGGMVGYPQTSSSSEYHCVWDIDSSGQASSTFGEGKTTEEMKELQTYFGWGCDEVWILNEGVDYPRLLWEGQPGILINYDNWFAGGEGTEQYPYLIETAEQLNKIHFADCLLDKHYQLISDIDLSGYDGLNGNPSFSMIGSYDMPFKGVVDGNDFVISNLHISANSGDYYGLFGKCHYATTVKNLTLLDPVVNAPNSDYVGAFAGNSGSSFANCHIINGQVAGATYVGGMSGYGGSYENCTITASIEGSSKVGGFAGYGAYCVDCSADCDVKVSGDYGGGFAGTAGSYIRCQAAGTIESSGDYVGGFIGSAGTQDIIECTASVTILGDGDYYGGIAGMMSNGEITNCTSSVTIGTSSNQPYESIGGLVGYLSEYSAVKDCSSHGTIYGSRKLGGLIGYQLGLVERSSSTVSVRGSSWGRDVGGLAGLNKGNIYSCRASGMVTGGRDNTGGLIGNNDGYNIKNCYARGSVNGSESVGGLIGLNIDNTLIVNCYSTGSVSGSSYVGGLIGQNTGSVGPSCYWDKFTSGRVISQGGIGKTTAEMKTAETFVGWGSEGVWTINEGVSTPHLIWENKPGQPISDQAYWPGNGTQGDPYTISTAEDMYLSGLASCAFEDSHFVLMADIDMSDYDGLNGNLQYQPIWNFNGVFNGNGYVISNLSITTLQQDNVGLFGSTGSSAKINNVVLIDPVINVTGNDKVGSLAGALGGKIHQSCSIGGSVNGYDFVGGLVGSGGYLEECFSTTEVNGHYRVGGLVGRNSNPMYYCYANGNVTGSSRVGGLIGENYYGGGYAVNCYSTGHVTGSPVLSQYNGGLVGSGYAANSSYTVNSYWNISSSGQSSSAGGEGKYTAEMQSMSGYDAWRCDGVWTIDEGNDYPRLKWENKPGVEISWYDNFSGGEGTLESPYLIDTAGLLNMISTNECLLGKHYKLTSDIDLVDYPGDTFSVIGSQDLPFTGTFDGSNHTISNFQYITSETQNNIGLFGYLNGAEIRNLKMENVEISAPQSSWVASLAGRGIGTVENCSAVNGTVTGNDFVGGLVGTSHIVYNCFADIEVSGDSSVGGLLGYSIYTVRNCYAHGSVYGTDYVGGMIGSAGSASNISNSFATGLVGGLYGKGGFAGRQAEYSGDKASFDACFWNITVNPDLWGVGGASVPEVIGETTENLKIQSTFTNRLWDFVGEDSNGTEDPWRMCQDGVNYPGLFWEYLQYGDFACPDGVEMNDLGIMLNCWLSKTHILSEITGDHYVNIEDIALLSQYWMSEDCGQCGGADITGDKKVDMSDLKSVIEDWLETERSECKIADLSGDNFVNMEDFSIFCGNWLMGVE